MGLDLLRKFQILFAEKLLSTAALTSRSFRFSGLKVGRQALRAQKRFCS